MNKASEVQISTLKISEDVIAKIVEIAISDIDGVSCLAKSKIYFGNLFSKSDAPSISVQVKDGAVDVTVSLIVSYNCNVKKVSEQVQLRIKNDIQNMTGIAVTKVNVMVEGISFDEK